MAIPSSISGHYRHFCPPGSPYFVAPEALKGPDGFFRFGQSVVCYGSAVGETRHDASGPLFDASQHVQSSDGAILLPFDPNQVFDNLRYERYFQPPGQQRWVETSWVKDIYYRLRPLFPVSFRKHLQKVYFRGWDAIPFPSWPVDRSVDILFERLLVLALQASQSERLPFIWFWPDGYQACANMTHDVETIEGRDFSGRLMDIDDEFGIKASFQVVPEKRYPVPPSYLESIRARRFEVNVHGLDHEGNLFEDRQTFLECARKINKYAEQFGAQGFRSPSMYRNVDWLQDLNFSYDMSMPNFAGLEPQRGGCCTVMPYFLPGGMTELPLTMIQDYSLFHIVKDYSTALWKKQMKTILGGHGLMSFIIHPDYVANDRAQGVYKALLGEISRLRSDHGVWVTLPGETNRWWRERSEMTLVPAGGDWKIEGIGSERARVAYACLDGDRLVYELEPQKVLNK